MLERQGRTTVLWRLAALAALLTSASGLRAQYFGRNKVVYRDFDFRVLRTPHYDVHYYAEELTATRDAARMAERWYARHSATFGDSVARRSLVLYSSPSDFQQTNVIPDQLTEGTGGVTEGYRSRVILPHTGWYQETDHVLGHELVHVFQYAAAMGKGEGGVQSTARLPLWLVEGMAEYISLGRSDPQTAMWMRAAVLRDKVPRYRELTDPRIFPYRYGQALCAYIGGRWGDGRLIALYKTALRQPLERAIQTTLGVAPDQLVADWTRDMRALYQPAMAGRADPAQVGRPVLSDERREAGLDVAPVVSPDGQYVAFFSSRSLFSIDLFIADVTTGRIVKRLTGPTGSSHFDAISFIYTAGTWSPDGRQFAFVTYNNGRNELAVVDVSSGDITRRLAVRGVSGISSPTWSPDGTRIVFSGQSGGISDLYLYTIASGAVARLTSDAFADLQPAWSPDGTSIAFITEGQEGTDLARLTYAPLALAVMNLTTRAVTPVPTFAEANVLNPQWSPDSRSLYFLSAPDGFQDIYRVELASGSRYRVTRTATGVSGIAAYSPAISVASRTGALFFSVFDRTGYRMTMLDSSAARGEAIPMRDDWRTTAGLLAPAEARENSDVEHRVHDATTGLVDGRSFEDRPYVSRLTLDAISPVSVGVATGSFGTGLAGGVSALWSDELGNRNVGLAVQALGELRDVGGQVFYADLKRRWQPVYSIGHIPYLTGFSTVAPETVTLPGGQTGTATVVTQYLQRIYFDQLRAGVTYPFSSTRRLEFSAGAAHVGFNTQVQRLAVIGNTVYDLGRRDTTSQSGLNFAQGSAALVFDNSVFGFTSPIAGGRYRFEFSPSVGDLTYSFVNADYRRYLFAKPFTLALRTMAYGRFGKDAESDRMSPLYVGDGSLVRGYSVYSFDPTECTSGVSGGSSCPEFDRLVGSRVGVANLEFRIPLFGTRDLGLLPTNVLPVEVSPFVDAGVAWTSDSRPKLVFERETADRVPIVSAGISSRFNLFGALVLEVFYAKPFQRPTKGWVWGLQLVPGW